MPRRHTPTIGVLLARDALANAVSAGRAALPKETGGILLGFRTPDHVVVTRVVVVEDPRSTRTRYLRRRRTAQQRLAAAIANAPAVIGYVGEWHTHPESQSPSWTDLQAVGDTARLAGGAVALLVVAFPPTGEPEVHARAALRRDEFPVPVIDVVDVVIDELTITDDTGESLEREASASIDTAPEGAPA
jgi:integrative and conjugative element protein (TIGR02256 family)